MDAGELLVTLLIIALLGICLSIFRIPRLLRVRAHSSTHTSISPSDSDNRTKDGTGPSLSHKPLLAAPDVAISTASVSKPSLHDAKDDQALSTKPDEQIAHDEKIIRVANASATKTASRNVRKRRQRFAKRGARKDSLRRALVIGVTEYMDALQFAPLPGVQDDAKKIADTLDKIYNFHVEPPVIGYCDVDKLNEVRKQFIESSKGAEVVLIYFVGHGFESQGRTFVVLSKAKIDPEYPRDFLRQCYECNELISDVIEKIRGKCIFIFDCCRDQLRELKTTYLEYQYAAEPRFRKNDLLIYSASLSQRAGDRTSFSHAFASELQDANKYFVDMLKAAASQVAQRANQDPQLRHEGDEFRNWHLMSRKSDYKQAKPGSNREPKFDSNLTGLSISVGGKYLALAAGESREIHVIESHELELRRTIRVPSKVYSLDFSPDGAHVIFGMKDGSVGLWQHQVDSELKVIPQICSGPINHVEWARKNNRIVAVSSDCTLRVLGFMNNSLRELARSDLRSGEIWAASIHRDGNYVVTGSHDKTCRLWHLDDIDVDERLQPRGTPLTFRAPVRVVRFSRQGGYLAVGTQDARVGLYEFDAHRDEFHFVDGFHHSRMSKRANLGKMERALNRNISRKWNNRPARIDAIQKSLFVISLDFSPDELVLAYGTNIDGYFLWELDSPVANRRIRSMERFLDRAPPQYRIPKLMYCPDKQRLYVANGDHIHCLYY